MMKKRAMIIVFTLFLMALTVLPVFASPDSSDVNRLYDEAGLFTEEQAAELEGQIEAARKATRMDLVVVTTSFAGGKTAREYADDFYDMGNYGQGKKQSGALFLIDMDNREIYISTKGDMIRFLTDSRVEAMLDHAYEGVSRGNYLASAFSFLADTQAYYKKGIESGQYNYDSVTGAISVHRSIRWYEALFAVGLSAFAAFSPCMLVINQYGMKKERQQASNYNMAYRAAATFAFAAAADQLLHESVSQRVIPRAPIRTGGGMGRGSTSGRSTTHMGGGGGVHGGGGRKF